MKSSCSCREIGATTTATAYPFAFIHLVTTCFLERDACKIIELNSFKVSENWCTRRWIKYNKFKLLGNFLNVTNLIYLKHGMIYSVYIEELLYIIVLFNDVIVLYI